MEDFSFWCGAAGLCISDKRAQHSLGATHTMPGAGRHFVKSLLHGGRDLNPGLGLGCLIVGGCYLWASSGMADGLWLAGFYSVGRGVVPASWMCGGAGIVS